MIQPRKIDVGETITAAWEVTKANLGLLVLVMIVAALATWVPSWIAIAMKRSSPGFAALFRLAGFVLTMIVGIGAVRISLRLNDGQPAALSDLFRADWSVFWRYAVATILYGLTVGVGLIFLVVPGVIMAVRYLLYAYFVVDRNARPVEALAQSAAATEGARWNLFMLLVALFIINGIGVLLLGLGLLVTIPLSYVATARVYRSLTTSVPAAP